MLFVCNLLEYGYDDTRFPLTSYTYSIGVLPAAASAHLGMHTATQTQSYLSSSAQKEQGTRTRQVG